MTEQEVRKLRVGDMVVFYEDSPNIKTDYTYFTMMVDGRTHVFDLGLIVKRNGDKIWIDWLAHGGGMLVADVRDAWEQIEKA